MTRNLRPVQQYLSHARIMVEDNETLCAMESRLQLKRSHQAGLEPGTARSAGHARRQ